MKVMRIGIMSQDRIRERLLKIAKGDLKPKRTDPKVWFTSMRTLAKVLSDYNRQLLEIIRAVRPVSVEELAELTGRNQSQLTRTLNVMAQYELVHMVRQNQLVRPVVLLERFLISV